MKLNEAKQLVSEKQHLIGKEIEGSIIDHIVVVPSKTGITQEMLQRIYSGFDYEDILSMHDDFNVLVIYDIEELMLKGVLRTDLIENIV